MDTQNKPGVYAKGGLTRIAYSPSTAVSLVFEGFKRVGDLPNVADAKVEESDTPAPEAVDPGAPAKPRPPRRPADLLESTPEVSA